MATRSDPSPFALLVLLVAACSEKTPPVAGPHVPTGAAHAAVVAPLAPVSLRRGEAEFTVDPATLAIASRGTPLSGPLEGSWAPVAGDVDADRVRFRIPGAGLSVDASVEGATLRVRIVSDREQELAWPRPSAEGTRALVLPIDEGLSLPVADPFWQARFREGDCRTAYGGLSMPFFGIERESASYAYVLASDLSTRVCVQPKDGLLTAVVKHAFSVREGLPPYDVVFAPADATPIGVALAYREFLESHGGLVSFAEKARALPQAARLAGAIHAYLWGDGATREAIDALARLGVDRALLAFDDDARRVTPGLVRYAESRGYLMARYDVLTNVQDPKAADSPVSVFDEALFRQGGVLSANGERRAGFGGRGYELSSEALRRSSVPYASQRIAAARALGAGAYFLDCDAFGELYADFDPGHPMTLARDRENRMTRMRAVVEAGFVLGSESAAAWSTPLVMFSHGTGTVATDGYWKLLADRKRFGGWFPPDRPGIHFRVVDLTDDERRELFDPTVRVPLYEAVFHDSVITTDRWEMSLTKARGLESLRTLLALLYGVPTTWNLDQRELREHGPRLAALARFFGPLHRRIASLPLAELAYLAPDRLLQRARFGRDVEVTANFAGEMRAGVRAGCVEVHDRATDARETFCPR